MRCCCGARQGVGPTSDLVPLARRRDPPGPPHPAPRRPPRCCRPSRPTLTLGSATVSPRAPGARPSGCGVVLASPSLLLPQRRGSLSAVTSQADGHDRCSRDAPPGTWRALSASVRLAFQPRGPSTGVRKDRGGKCKGRPKASVTEISETPCGTLLTLKLTQLTHKKQNTDISNKDGTRPGT